MYLLLPLRVCARVTLPLAELSQRPCAPLPEARAGGWIADFTDPANLCAVGV